MKARLRQLEIRIRTDEGNYGATLPFRAGLNVLRAENTSGKSTCLQSILFALALERMLGPYPFMALPDALTDRLIDKGRYKNVLSSEVLLELENVDGSVITIRRTVKGERSRNLITVWRGPFLTQGTQALEQEDFYAVERGASQNPGGFHTELAKFFGWNLPLVPRFDGTDCLLYLESVFPFLIVEQKTGWLSVSARMPTFLRIQEMFKRSFEFLLNLDAYRIALERQRLIRVRENLLKRWQRISADVSASVRPLNGSVQGFPSEPPLDGQAIRLSLYVPQGKEWIKIENAISEKRNQLERLSVAIPTAEAASAELSAELDEARKSLSDSEALYALIHEEYDTEFRQFNAIKVRLEALHEDLVKHQDAEKLQRLGSTLNVSALENSTCPTCHQQVSDVLLPQSPKHTVMPLEDNITFIKGQIETFARMRANSERLLNAKEAEIAAVRQQIGNLQRKIRSLKETLVSPAGSPSLASLRERVLLEESIELHSRIVKEVADLAFRGNEVSTEFSNVHSDLDKLPVGPITPADNSKLERMTQYFVSQLKEFGFNSFPAAELQISRDTYRPARGNFDMGYVSASDNIRVIWAYLNSILELSRDFETNHLGLLILDEPKQQSASDLSFSSLLRRVSTSQASGDQVIFATSEKLPTIKEMLKNIPHTLLNFDGWLLRRSD